jgi:hypothetical protein
MQTFSLVAFLRDGTDFHGVQERDLKKTRPGGE